MLNEQPREAGTPPPTRGQHTAVILDELGLSRQDIERLLAAGVVE